MTFRELQNEYEQIIKELGAFNKKIEELKFDLDATEVNGKRSQDVILDIEERRAKRNEARTALHTLYEGIAEFPNILFCRHNNTEKLNEENFVKYLYDILEIKEKRTYSFFKKIISVQDISSNFNVDLKVAMPEDLVGKLEKSLQVNTATEAPIRKKLMDEFGIHQVQPEHPDKDQIESIHPSVKSFIFVGRDAELQRLEGNFLFQPDSFIFNIHTAGEGGVGKTRLLQQMLELCRSSKYTDRVIAVEELIDFYHTESRSQAGIIEQVIRQLGREQFLNVQDKLEKYRQTKDSSERQYLLDDVLTALKKDYKKFVATAEQKNKTIVLLFDTYEVIQRIDKEGKDATSTGFSEWLETKFFPGLRSDSTRIIVAGRYPFIDIDKAQIEVEENILALFDFSAAADFLIECLMVAEFSEKSYQNFTDNYPQTEGFLDPYRYPLGDNRVGIWMCEFPDDYRLELGEKVWQELSDKIEITCQDDLLDELGLTENEFRTLFHPTGSSDEENIYRPIYLALFMDWWRFNLGKFDPAELLEQIQRIGNKERQQEAFNKLLVQRVGQNYKERVFIYRMAVAYRRMTGGIMQYLTDYSFEYCQKMLLEKLAPLSFIKHKQCAQKGDVVLLHDEMRNLIEKYWQEEDPGRKQSKEISSKLVCYYRNEFLSPDYQLTSLAFSKLQKKRIPGVVLDRIKDINVLYFTEADFQSALKDKLNQDEFDEYASVLVHVARQEVLQAKREVYVPELIEYAFMADTDDGTQRFCKEFDAAMEDGRYPYAAILGREAESCCAKYSGSSLNTFEIKRREVQYYIDSDKINISKALSIINWVDQEQHADKIWENTVLYGGFMLWKGIACFWLDDFDQAIHFLHKAKKKFLAHQEQESSLFFANNWIGYAYYRKAEFQEAEGWMQQSLEGLLELLAKELYADKTKKRNIQQRIQYVYGNLAMLYRYNGKFSEAIRYAEAAHDIVIGLPRNKREIFRSLNTISHVLAVAGRSMDARYYLEQAEKVYKEIPDRLLGGRLHINFSLLSYGSLEFVNMMEYYRAEELREAVNKIDSQGDGQQAEQMKNAVRHITKAIDILKGEPDSPVVAHKELADAYLNLGELYMMTPKASRPKKWREAEQAFLRAVDFAEISQFRYSYIDALESLVTLYYFWNRAAENLLNETKVENEQKKEKCQEKLANLHSEIKGYPSLMGRYELTLGDIAFDNALDLIKDGTFHDSNFRAGMRLLKISFDHYVSSALFKKEFNRDRYYLVLRVLYNRLNTLIKKMGIVSRWVFDWLEKYRKEWAYQIPEFSIVFDYVVSLHTIPEDGEKIISQVKQQIKQTEEKGDLRYVILLNKCLIDAYQLQANATGQEQFQEKLVGRLNRQSRVYRHLGDVHSARLCYERAREVIAGCDAELLQIIDPVLKRGLEGCTDIVEGEFYFRQGGYGSLLEYFLHDELPYARRRFDRQFKGFRKKALFLLTRGASRLEETLERLQLPERVHGAEAKKQKVFLYKQIRYYYRQLAEAYFQLGELLMMNGHFQENDQDGPGAFEYLKQAIEACEASENYYRHDDAIQSYLNAIYFSGNYNESSCQEEIKKYEQELEDKISVDGYKYSGIAARLRITQGDVLFSRYFKMEEQVDNAELESYSVVPRQAEVNRGELLAIFRNYVEACEYKAHFNDLSFEAGLRVLRRRIELIPDSASLDVLSEVLRQIWQEGKCLRRKTEELNSILQLIKMRSLTGSLIQRYEQ